MSDGIPRWLELQAEIDYRLFLLGEIKRHLMTARSPMDILVDEAVYRPKAGQLMAEVDALKAEFFAEIGDDSPVVSSVVLPQDEKSEL